MIYMLKCMYIYNILNIMPVRILGKEYEVIERLAEGSSVFLINEGMIYHFSDPLLRPYSPH